MPARLSPMRATFGIQALLGHAEPLHGAAAHQVLFDDCSGIGRLDIAVPDGLGIDDDGWSVLALVQAAGLVDADAGAEAGGFGQLLQLGMQFALAVGRAGRARCAFGADVMADKDVAFKRWQTGTSWIRVSPD